MDSLLLYGIFLILLLILLIVVYARWNYGQLEKMGIPIQPPTFLFGSCPDFYKKNPQLEDIERFKKYGSIFGLYEGRAPQIFIADPELLKLIFVKDYEHFSSRARIDLGHPISNELLDYLPDDRWKAVRSMLTPSLTNSRIRQTMESTSRIADEFACDLMTECTGDRMAINLRLRIIAVLIDITATGLFGMELKNRRKFDNPFVQMLREILCEHVHYDFRYTLMLQFPILLRLFPQWPFPHGAVNEFRDVMLNYCRARREESVTARGERRPDVGDIFVDMMNRVGSPDFQKVGITEATAISQVLEIFFAAYDSTGTALSMCIYHIAHNQEVQEKVLQEVDDIWEKHGRHGDDDDGSRHVLAYEGLGELTYLTACINEALRLSPSFIRPERLCTKDWSAQSKDSGLEIRLKKGQNVLIPIWALHRHPDYFPDPEKFDPERFMPQNRDKLYPYSFVPFGHGPKNCIGMTLAYTNMKVVLARLFKDFRFEVRPDTKLEYKKGTRFVVQYGPIYLDLVKRWI